MDQDFLKSLLYLPINKRIESLRNRKNISQKVLGDFIGGGQGYISRIEKGIQKLSKAKLEKIAEFFKIDESYLSADKKTADVFDAEPIKDGSSQALSKLLPDVPFYGSASAGRACDQYTTSSSTADELMLPTDIYTIRVHGDSMERFDNTGINNGDLVLVKAYPYQWSDLIGKLVVVRLDQEEHLIKRLVKVGNKLFLKSDNPIYPLIDIDENTQLEGEVLYVIRRPR